MATKGTKTTAKKTTAKKKNLVIVESPAKAKTIKKYLGSGYSVIASMGHLRDLPKSQLGVDIDNNFEPKYITIRGKGDLIASLKKEAKKSDKIYLATSIRDEDVTKYVYSLYLMGRGGTYTSDTSVEVTAFDDEDQAQAYFDTMSDVVDVYQNHPVVRQMDQILRPRIKMFHDMFMAR